jgi:hypothetical protein
MQFAEYLPSSASLSRQPMPQYAQNPCAKALWQLGDRSVWKYALASNSVHNGEESEMWLMDQIL